jgi:hypothetical protein
MFIPTEDPRFDGMTVQQIVDALTARVENLMRRAGVTRADRARLGLRHLNGCKHGYAALFQAITDLHFLTENANATSALFIDNGRGGFWAQPGTRSRLAGYDYLCARECDRVEAILNGTFTTFFRTTRAGKHISHTCNSVQGAPFGARYKSRPATAEEIAVCLQRGRGEDNLAAFARQEIAAGGFDNLVSDDIEA